MKYDGIDLYSKWQDGKEKNSQESYNDFVKRISKELSLNILKRLEFLIHSGYKPIYNADKQIGCFIKEKGKVRFSFRYQTTDNVLDLSVFYDKIQKEFFFNGDGGYSERITLQLPHIELTKEGIEIAEKTIIEKYNRQIELLKVKVNEN